MPGAAVPIVPGETHGYWTITGEATRSPTWPKFRRVHLRCRCGAERIAFLNNVRRGKTKSCGCYRRDVQLRHGRSGSPEWKIWFGIKQRCNPHHGHKYATQGIRVCDRWLGRDGFANFYADLGPQPSPRHSVHRKDNAKGYSPDNCRWATPDEQAQERDCVKLTPGLVREIRAASAAGERQVDLARRYNVKTCTIRNVVYRRTWKNIE